MARSERRRTRSRRTAPGGDRQQLTGTTTEAATNGTGSGPGVPVATSTAPRPSAPKRGFSPFGWLRRFRPRAVGDVISELRKVTWPTMAETRYLTFVVVVVAVTVGIILGLFDLAFGWAIETVFFD